MDPPHIRGTPTGGIVLFMGVNKGAVAARLITARRTDARAHPGIMTIGFGGAVASTFIC